MTWYFCRMCFQFCYFTICFQLGKNYDDDEEEDDEHKEVLQKYKQIFFG